MRELPARQPQANACGQRYWDNQISTVRILGEPGSRFMRVGYPASGVNYGGAAPSSFAISGDFPSNGGRLYVGQYMRWSSNWWHPANEGHKTLFLQEADGTTRHFFAWVDNPGTLAGRLLFKFGTQWGSQNAGRPYWDAVWTDQNPSNAIRKGEWHLVEFLIEPNAPGMSNGRLTAWVDGRVVVDARDVPFFREGATQRWTGVYFSPIYASPPVLPPADQYFDLSHMRVMVR
jgi:hypothetical protein